MTDQIRKVNGRNPINSQYAGRTMTWDDLSSDAQVSLTDYVVNDPVGKLFKQNGVQFSKEGFPDFSPYAIAEVAVTGSGTLRADDYHDVNFANAKAGFDETPDGCTWNHVEDFKRMQLLPTNLHRAIGHTGGRAIGRELQKNPDMVAPPAARNSLIETSMDVQRGYQQERILRQAQAAEHHAGRAMGVAAVGVDLAQGNASAAAMDTAAVVAQTRTAQEIAVKAVAHVGLTTTFNRVMRAIPMVGSYMAYRSMQSEVDSFTEAKRPDLAEAAYQVGKAEVLGNVLGGWTADAAREATRAEYVRQGGRDYEQLAHAGSVQLAITTKDIVVGSDAEKPIAPPDGKPLAEVLPPNHASMALGADAMGERSEISRIAVERTGLAASDPGNNMSVLMQEANRPTGHLLVLEDGRVQGPESGAVPFASNPQIAAGKNGGTLGILYAGTGAMNDAQWNTVSQVRDWLGQQRTAEGLPAQTELIAGSTATAQILNLPTPRGPLPETVAPQPGMAPTKARQALAHSTP